MRAPAGHVLRHVETRSGMSVEEAEGKMTEILEDLFKHGGNHEMVMDGGEK
jgi:hypothetical protein